MLSDYDFIEPIHPGEILLKEFMEPLGISRTRLAKATGIPLRTIRRLVKGKHSIDLPIATWLGLFLGTSAGFWMGLQTNYNTLSFLYDLDKSFDKPWKVRYAETEE